MYSIEKPMAKQKKSSKNKLPRINRNKFGCSLILFIKERNDLERRIQTEGMNEEQRKTFLKKDLKHNAKMKEKGKIKMADEKKHENAKRKKKLKNRKER